MDEIFQERLNKISKDLNNCAFILFSGDKKKRNANNTYPFRINSNFYYLTGIEEDNCVFLLIIKDNQKKTVLFCKDNSLKEQIWYGSRVGIKGHKQNPLIDEVYDITFKDELAPKLLSNIEAVYFPFEQEQKVFFWVKQIKRSKGAFTPYQFVDINKVLKEMRLFKDATEIAIMRKVASISAQAHTKAMQNCAPGMTEAQLEVQYLNEFFSHGLRFCAYEPIVASGENACILHYVKNNKQLKSGDLVLVDCAAELDNYAADITRTYPINGKFTSEQQAIYELVLAAQLKAIEVAIVGNPWVLMQQEILKILVQGLIDLGILSGNINELIENKVYEKYYMHNSGHWLGLDVHDIGGYKIGENWRNLQANQVLTIEPGLYFSKQDTQIDEKWRGIGVRIEDDILITESGPQILSFEAPKQINEIEKLMEK